MASFTLRMPGTVDLTPLTIYDARCYGPGVLIGFVAMPNTRWYTTYRTTCTADIYNSIGASRDA